MKIIQELKLYCVIKLYITLVTDWQHPNLEWPESKGVSDWLGAASCQHLTDTSVLLTHVWGSIHCNYYVTGEVHCVSSLTVADFSNLWFLVRLFLQTGNSEGDTYKHCEQWNQRVNLIFGCIFHSFFLSKTQRKERNQCNTK